MAKVPLAVISAIIGLPRPRPAGFRAKGLGASSPSCAQCEVTLFSWEATRRELQGEDLPSSQQI